MDKNSNRFLSHGISTLTTPINDENDDVRNVENSLVSNIALPISTNAPHTIFLYVLRQADPNDTWKIQAIFDNDIKYIFKPVKSLTRQKVSLMNVVDVRDRLLLDLFHTNQRVGPITIR